MRFDEIIHDDCSYFGLFRFLYDHNNGTSILPPEVRKSRNRSTTQTMMGQIYFFVLKILYVGFLAVAFGSGVKSVSPHYKDLAIIYKTLEFGLLSVTECLFIPDIRKSIFKQI